MINTNLSSFVTEVLFSFSPWWDWWILFWVWGFLHHQGTTDILWDSKGSTEQQEGWTYVSNNVEHAGSGSQQNSHRSPQTQTWSSHLASPSKSRSSRVGITSDLPYPRFPSLYFSCSVRQTRRRTSLSCFKSLSKAMKSGHKSCWVFGDTQQRRTHGAVAPIADEVDFLMSGTFRDGATTIWGELQQVLRAAWSSEIDFPGNLDPSAFPVKWKVHRIVLKGKITASPQTLTASPPPIKRILFFFKVLGCFITISNRGHFDLKNKVVQISAN